MDLNKFCKKGHSVWGEPWSSGDFSFASNTSVIVQVPRVDGIPENEKAPNIDMVKKMFWGLMNMDGEWHDLSDIKVQYVKCHVCNGTGKVVTCRECDGEGMVYFSNAYNEYEFECESCMGDGFTPSRDGKVCASCNGEGTIVLHERIKLGNTFFSSENLALIKDLPNVRLKTFENQYQTNTSATASVFEFDGWIGFIMPMSKGDF